MSKTTSDILGEIHQREDDGIGKILNTFPTEGLTAKLVDEEPPWGKGAVLGWFGGDARNPTWEEYIAEATPKLVPYLEAVRTCCERDDHVGLCGNELQARGSFKFSNGVYLGLSWRAWGDFMQALVGKREGYMAYYMRRIDW
jgi:hypothetical protein